MSEIDRMLSVAEAEVGYLEKKTNENLDSKTANAGSNNFTKYWRDLKPDYQKEPWCNAFVNWVFVQAFGEKRAKSLLCTSGSWSYYTPTSAGFFKNKKQWYSAPKKGDVIYFKNSSRIHHVGIVYKVDSKKVYTIEGNTSKASGVIANGGGVAKKSYALSYGSIAGYGRPAYSAETQTTETKESGMVTIELMTLCKGCECDDVRLAKVLLNHTGATLDTSNKYFGTTTETMVKEFQTAKGLKADGVIGKDTWKALMGV